jgi:predicted Zn-dependent peptidase
MFKELSAYVGGNADPGLFVISGKLKEGVSFEDADAAICAEIDEIIQQGVSNDELEKVKNKAESTLVFGEMGALNKAMNLAFAELMGDANLVNLEQERIRAVTADAIQREAATVLTPSNCSTLYYAAKA